MDEFIATLTERACAARASLLAAVAEGDHYSAELHEAELQFLGAVATAHGVVIPAQAGAVPVQGGAVPAQGCTQTVVAS